MHSGRERGGLHELRVRIKVHDTVEPRHTRLVQRCQDDVVALEKNLVRAVYDGKRALGGQLVTIEVELGQAGPF